MARRSAGWMFAALRAVGEAALRPISPEDLFQKVCEIVVRDCKTGCAGVLLADAGGTLRLVASAGEGLERLRAMRLPVGPGSSDGVATTIPIRRGGASIGVFAFCTDQLESLGDPITDLLKHVVEKVSSALDGFDRERELQRIAESNDRLNRRFRSPECDERRHAQGAQRRRNVPDGLRRGDRPRQTLRSASVAFRIPIRPGSARVACSGKLAHVYGKMSTSADPDLPEGRAPPRGFFATGKPCFVADIRNDPRMGPLRSLLLAEGVTAGAVLPLVKGGRVVGVCSFFFGADSGPLDDERIQLTSRIAENIAFGMELFERQEQKDNVTHMFVALSATNEAIMRAQTRAELFELVCEAAVKGGNFTATLIGLAQSGSDFFRIAASAGPTAATSKNARLAISADQPEGRGLDREGVSHKAPLHQQRLPRGNR